MLKWKRDEAREAEVAMQIGEQHAAALPRTLIAPAPVQVSKPEKERRLLLSPSCGTTGKGWRGSDGETEKNSDECYFCVSSNLGRLPFIGTNQQSTLNQQSA